MNQREFHDAVRRIAGAKYFSTMIDASENRGRISITYKAYVENGGWHDAPTAEQVLVVLASGEPTLEQQNVKLAELPAPPVAAAPEPADTTTDEVPW